MTTGERYAPKGARTVREGADGKGPEPRAPRRRPTSLVVRHHTGTDAPVDHHGDAGTGGEPGFRADAHAGCLEPIWTEGGTSRNMWSGTSWSRQRPAILAFRQARFSQRWQRSHSSTTPSSSMAPRDMSRWWCSATSAARCSAKRLVRHRRGDLGADDAVVGHLVDAVAAGQAHVGDPDRRPGSSSCAHGFAYRGALNRHGPLIADGRHGSSWRYQAIAESIASTWASGSRPRGATIWSRNAGGRRYQHHLHAKCAGDTWRRHPPGQA